MYNYNVNKIKEKIMKRKELELLAKNIIAQEQIIRNANNPIEVKAAKNKIVELSSSIKSLEDMLIIDELIQKYFKNI